MLLSLIIIIFILMGGFIGMQRGAIKELVSVVGFLIVLALSFAFKNPLANLFYEYLPFFDFDGITALNIVFYEALSFIILASIFGAILKIILSLTSVVETLLNATIILGIPSKIIGAILGIIEYICFSFIILYFASIKYNVRADSKVANVILNDTPILSSVCDKSLSTISEIYNIKNEYDHNTDDTIINHRIIEVMIDNKVITEKKVNELIEKNKLKI